MLLTVDPIMSYISVGSGMAVARKNIANLTWLNIFVPKKNIMIPHRKIKKRIAWYCREFCCVV